MCYSKADIKVAHTSHPVGPIWGNKGHNKTLLPSRSVLGPVHSIALPRLKLISASFAITRPRWALAPRVCLQPVVLKCGHLGEFHKLSPFMFSNAMSLTAHLCTLA